MSARTPVKAWLVSLVMGVVFVALTVLVWRQQVHHQRALLKKHTRDVCEQAARRLQVFVESHLRMANIFARRWSTHEERDFSRQRFDEFASVLVSQLPGYHAISLVQPDRSTEWVSPAHADRARVVLGTGLTPLLEAALAAREVVLSQPLQSHGEIHFYAGIPLFRDDEPLGYLLVHFQASTLINDCFHNRLRSEFHFQIEDQHTLIFTSVPQLDPDTIVAIPGREHISFGMHNRTWELSLFPMRLTAASAGWGANLAVPLFGFSLTIGLCFLIFALMRRMDMLRIARDEAFREVDERKRTEAALAASEVRHAQLSRKVLAAQEEERARLSRELHDELGQMLTAMRLHLGWMKKKMRDAPVEQGAMLEDTVLLVESATDELRRICRGLRPPLLDDLGLEPAIGQLVDEFEGCSTMCIETKLEIEEAAVPHDVALTVYRVLQEAITNVLRHAGATHIHIEVRASNGGVRLQVDDDGHGFEPANVDPGGGVGLEGMRERAILVQGGLRVTSHPGQGTRIELFVPAADHAASAN